jgi:hypothetical protein
VRLTSLLLYRRVCSVAVLAAGGALSVFVTSAVESSDIARDL